MSLFAWLPGVSLDFSPFICLPVRPVTSGEHLSPFILKQFTSAPCIWLCLPYVVFLVLGFVSHQCPISSILSDVLAWPRLFSTCLPICLPTRLPWTDRFPPVSHFSSCLICLSPHLRRPWAEGFPLFSHWLSHLFSYLSPYFLAFLRLKCSHLCPTSLIICILICGGPGCGSLC
jgi:hypothetical protein